MLDSERKDKIESYLHVINRLQTDAMMVRSEIDRQTEMESGKIKALNNTKNWLVSSMKDGEKHEFDLFKVSRVKGRQVLQVNDGYKLPKSYYTHKPESWSLDRREVLKALKAGEKIEGVEISVGEPSLRIK